VLRARGFTNVVNLAGGFAAWERAGYPVERDAAPEAREAAAAG
jgi:rhodanese-related sulfurtransferase